MAIVKELSPGESPVHKSDGSEVLSVSQIVFLRVNFHWEADLDQIYRTLTPERVKPMGRK